MDLRKRHPKLHQCQENFLIILLLMMLRLSEIHLANILLTKEEWRQNGNGKRSCCSKIIGIAAQGLAPY
jgi:3-dehydroquinate dehydratase